MSADIRLDRERDQRNENTNSGKHGADGINHGQDPVPIRDDEESQETQGVEDEQQLPVPDGEIGLEEVDGGGHEGGEAEVDRERDGPVPDEPGPARDEGEHGAVLGAGELEGPVIWTGGCWVSRCELA